MKIKKYEVYDMKEALRLIKEDLGPEAVILSTRKIMKSNNFGLFSRPVIEVTAAIDYDERAYESAAARKPGERRETVEGEPIVRKETPATHRGIPAYGPNSRTTPPGKSVQTDTEDVEEIIRQAQQRTQVGPERSAPRTPAYQTSGQKQAAEMADAAQQQIERLAELINTVGLSRFEGLMNDVADIKKQLSTMQSSMSDNMVIDLPENLKEYYPLLIKNGVDDMIAYKFLKQIEKRMTDTLSKSQVKNLVMQLLSELIPVEKNYFDKLERKVVALVGPTGVGKTTTIAKMAATLSLKLKKKVCLITIDNFRIGAVEQLRTYAEIVNIPLYVASSPEELEDIIRDTESFDYVFLDSMGRSQFDTDQINALKEFTSVSDAISVALVMSLSANHNELMETYDRYSGLEPEYLVFTKLDETRYFGPLVNLPIRKKAPLLLFANGQNVPEDMEIPDGKKIARKVLNEIPVLWSD